MTQLELWPYANTYAINLSGGNKRKLMCLICLLGSPKLVFLDDPTRGVDPVVRIKIGQLIKTLTSSATDSSFVFTTHCMSEAEQICDRICIMINGRIITMGSINYLRDTYGDGQSLTIHGYNTLNAGIEHEDEINIVVMELDTSAVRQNIMSMSQTDLTFKIGSKIKLSQVFLKLN